MLRPCKSKEYLIRPLFNSSFIFHPWLFIFSISEALSAGKVLTKANLWKSLLILLRELMAEGGFFATEKQPLTSVILLIVNSPNQRVKAGQSERITFTVFYNQL